MKTCTKCGESKATSEYYKHKRSADGLGYSCKDCHRAVVRARYQKDPSILRPQRLKKYGITIKLYDEMLASQDGVCAICHKPEIAEQFGRVQPLAVDHCHTTGKVRSLLCTSCNTGLGKFRDDPSLLRQAAEYLHSHQTT